MIFNLKDFNGAAEYFATTGFSHWQDLQSVIGSFLPQFQSSDQAGKIGVPIFDPKATNAKLTKGAAALGWDAIPVPTELRPFGVDWDGGKGPVLAEWQFSNYPFLWNNVIRTEAVFQSRAVLPGLDQPVEALVVVTKSGRFPASNSTLYYEQARAQLDTVTTLGVFNIPIRLVGLDVDPNATTLEIDWNQYSGRYGRNPISTQRRTMNVAWSRHQSAYGYSTLKLN